MTKRHVDRDNMSDRPRARDTDPYSSQESAAIIRSEEGPSRTIRKGSRMHEALDKAWFMFQRDGYFVARLLGGQLWKRVSDLKDGGYVNVMVPNGYWDVGTGRHVDMMGVTEKGRARLRELGPWSE
jgi:hypothetical protein